ncbi:VOC family protein [Porticoccaceae bacterium LTM1]|nr:VOC family protein [Porticoccaceae bacterium LTM1]
MKELRALDHFVVVGQEMEKRIEAFRDLGFYVGPIESHLELGSKNCIIHFANTYLELVDFGEAASWLSDPYGKFIESCQSGIAHISLRTCDIDLARKSAENQGLNPDKIIYARRKVTHPDGQEDETDSACFYAWRDDNPYLSVFLSEHRKPETIFVEEYSNHANTATDVVRLVYMSVDPASDIHYFSKQFGKDPDEVSSDGFKIVGSRGEITEVLTPMAAVRRYGGNILRDSPQPLNGFCVAIHMAVRSDSQVRMVLDENQKKYSDHDGYLIIPSSESCGFAMVFEHSSVT